MPIRIIRPIFTFSRTQDQASSWSVFVEHLNGAWADDAWRSVVDAWIGGTLVQWLEGQQLHHCAEAVKKLECKKNDAVENQQLLASALFGGEWPDGVKKAIEQEETARRLALDEKYQEEQRQLAEKKRQEEMRLEEERRREEQRRHGMAIPGEDWTAELPGGVKLEMVWVEPGKFLFGCTFHDYGPEDLKNLCEVTLTKGYWIGRYPFTQEQWKAIGAKKSESNQWNRPRLPVEHVSWDEAMKCCKKLGDQLSDQLPSNYCFDLPTEAQWEFAARGGVKTQDYEFSGGNVIGDVAWYIGNSGGRTHEVGLKKPNELGIYDMSGNVWEWCHDWNGSYPSGTVADPAGPSSGSRRVLRGGSWSSVADYCRSAYRCNFDPSIRYPDLGFRVALVPVQ